MKGKVARMSDKAKEQDGGYAKLSQEHEREMWRDGCSVAIAGEKMEPPTGVRRDLRDVWMAGYSYGEYQLRSEYERLRPAAASESYDPAFLEWWLPYAATHQAEPRPLTAHAAWQEATRLAKTDSADRIAELDEYRNTAQTAARIAIDTFEETMDALQRLL